MEACCSQDEWFSESWLLLPFLCFFSYLPTVTSSPTQSHWFLSPDASLSFPFLGDHPDSIHVGCFTSLWGKKIKAHIRERKDKPFSCPPFILQLHSHFSFYLQKEVLELSVLISPYLVFLELSVVRNSPLQIHWRCQCRSAGVRMMLNPICNSNSHLTWWSSRSICQN